ncbi:MAG: RNA methyltransferase [Oscillospiraceae bacterium]|jgi:TrmH family RNA methyltransferase
MFDKTITSKDNSNIKLFQKLVTLKKARDEHNLFPLEGLRLINDAIAENSVLHCVFISEKLASKYSEAIEALDKKGYSDRIFYVTPEVERKLSGTVNPQGIYAICKKLDKFFNADKILDNGKYIILNDVRDPGNIGTVIRTADAVGVDGIILTGDCCDIYNPKAVRSTMGSLFRMNIMHSGDIADALKAFHDKKAKSFAAVVEADALSLTECDFSGTCVVVIGNEGSGLSSEAADLCNQRLTIKMQGGINSLNAAMAAGIIMWEMFRQ